MRSNSLSLHRVLLLVREPVVEDRVVELDPVGVSLAVRLRQMTSDAVAVGGGAGDGAEPVGAVRVLLEGGPSQADRRSSRSNAALKVCGAAMCFGPVRPISQLKVSSRSTLTSRLSSDLDA